MSNLGGGEIFAVLLLALIVLGPERLPEAARKVGDFVRQVRSMSSGFQDEVRKAIDLGGDHPFTPEESHIVAVPDRAPADEIPVAEDLDADIRAKNDAVIEASVIDPAPAVVDHAEEAASSPPSAEPTHQSKAS